jgi:hypothetical protein
MKKEHSDYHNEYYGTKKKFKKKFFVGFLGIFLVAASLLMFYGSGGITGNVIGNIDYNNSVEIRATLSVPEFSLNDKYKEVTLDLNKGAVIKIDDKEIKLKEDDNKIVLADFDGSIGINENYLSELSGKVSEIKINNVPLTSQKGGKIKVILSDNSGYSFFEISEGVYFRNLFFESSGSLFFGEDSLVLNSEDIGLRKYFGKLTIQDKELILEGIVEGISIEGSSRKMSLSR